MPIKATRALLAAALDGSLHDAEFRTDPNFGFEVPLHVHDVPDILLNPRRTWNRHEEYDKQAEKLVKMFADNFQQYEPFVDDDVKAIMLGKDD